MDCTVLSLVSKGTGICGWLCGCSHLYCMDDKRSEFKLDEPRHLAFLVLWFWFWFCCKPKLAMISGKTPWAGG